MEQHELHAGKNDSVPSQSKSISKDAERKRKSRSELTEDDKINEREKAKKRMRTIRDNIGFDAFFSSPTVALYYHYFRYILSTCYIITTFVIFHRIFTS